MLKKKILCKLCNIESDKELITNKIYGDITNKKKFYKCKYCDVVFQYPFFSKNEEKKFYKSEFEKYMNKRSLQKDGWEDPDTHVKKNFTNYKRRVKFFKKYLSKKTKFLEIGCSSGFMLYPLMQKKIDCYGIEPSNIFEKFLKKNKVKVFSSLKKLKEKNKKLKFDLITHFFVLEHMINPLEFFQEQMKILKKNGKIIFEVPCYSDPLYSLYNLNSFDRFYWSVVHPWYFNLNSLKYLLEKLNCNYKIYYEQRYGISNHLNWMINNKPGGSKIFDTIFDRKFDKLYKKKLISAGFADTIIGVISK